MNLLIYFLVMILLKFEIYIAVLILWVVLFIGPMQGVYLGNSIITIIIIDILISIFIGYLMKKTP